MWNIMKLEPEDGLYGIEKDGIIIASFPAICLKHVEYLLKVANPSNNRETDETNG